VTGADIVTAARAWLGVRYRHQGRDREGVDCIGLPVCVRADLGLAPMDSSLDYAPLSEGTEMLDYCRAHMQEVDRTAIAPGDILVHMDGAMRHMAIVSDYAPDADSLAIIHAWLPNRRVVECRLDGEFMARVRGCFRFPEVTE
jgi:hypothetical protein